MALTKQFFFKKSGYNHGLRRLFNEFGSLLSRYDTPPREAAYWYGERALTGLLAAAAWRLKDGWALEEFCGVRVNRKKIGSGRGDLWVGVGQKCFTVEAKVIWPGGNSETAVIDAKRKLGLAKRQLSCLHREYRVGRPLALCYVVPEFNRNGRSDRQEEKFVKKLAAGLMDRNIMICSFEYRKSCPRYKGKNYPGVILVAEQSQW